MWLHIVIVIVWSGLKFMVGVGWALAHDFSFGLSILTTFGGGFLGVILFTYFGELVKSLIARIRPTRQPRPQKKSSRRERLIVRLEKKGGIWAIALLTPVLLTVPIGTLAAVSFQYRRKAILFAMAVSFACWTLLIFGLYKIMGIDLSQYLGNL